MPRGVVIFRDEELKTNLRDLAVEVLRELWMSSRKVGMYSPLHPSVRKAAEKPFFFLNTYFKYKSVFSCVIEAGRLFVGGIPIPPLVFSTGIVAELERAAVDRLLIRSEVTINDLAVLLDRLSKRFPPSDFHHQYSQYLITQKVYSIEINSEFARVLFAQNNFYDPEIEYDFSVVGMVQEFLRQKPDTVPGLLAGEWSTDRELLEEGLIEFRLRVLQDQLTRVITNYSDEQILLLVQRKAAESLTASQDEQSRHLTALKTLLRSLALNRDRQGLLEKVEQIFTRLGIAPDIYKKTFDEATLFRLRTAAETESILQSALAVNLTRAVYSNLDRTRTEAQSAYSERFREAFSRLSACHYEEKIKQVLEKILFNMAQDDKPVAQIASALLRITFEVLNSQHQDQLYDFAVGKFISFIKDGKATFVFIDSAEAIVKECISGKHYDLLSDLAFALRERTEQSHKVEAPEPVIQQLLIRIGASEVVEALLQEISRVKSPHHTSVRKALIAINNPEVAKRLAQIVTHPERSVRTNALRVLTQLGSHALEIFSHILSETLSQVETLSVNEIKPSPERALLSSRAELNESIWYTLRNAIHVLGSLKDQRAVEVLAQCTVIADPRVRREVARALEKIGGSAAIEIQKQLTADPDPEVRKTAIIALGLIGSSADVAFLRELMLRNTTEQLPIVYAIGNLSGTLAKDFFLELLDNTSDLHRNAFGRGQDSELKAAILKGLSKITDPDSRQRALELADSMTKTQKIFLRKLPFTSTPKNPTKNISR